LEERRYHAGGTAARENFARTVTQDRDEIFGDVPDAPRFPLLLKLLDSDPKLSLQVHPPDGVASRLVGEPKTAFWHVAANLSHQRHQSATTGDLQLAEDGMKMFFHRFETQAAFVGNLLIAAPIAH
jgi:hypothetical protein